jgi:hypothetical protein
MLRAEARRSSRLPAAGPIVTADGTANAALSSIWNARKELVALLQPVQQGDGAAPAAGCGNRAVPPSAAKLTAAADPAPRCPADPRPADPTKQLDRHPPMPSTHRLNHDKLLQACAALSQGSSKLRGVLEDDGASQAPDSYGYGSSTARLSHAQVRHLALRLASRVAHQNGLPTALCTIPTSPHGLHSRQDRRPPQPRTMQRSRPHVGSPERQLITSNRLLCPAAGWPGHSAPLRLCAHGRARRARGGYAGDSYECSPSTA